MNTVDTALARSRIYRIIGRLFLGGVTADLLPYLDEIPELSGTLSKPFNQDEAAAEHYHIFSYDIFPYENIFRDPSGLLGGSYTERVKSSYQDAGVQILTDEDHIGHELSFIASLCEAEYNMLQKHEQQEALRHVHLQNNFLRDHLLCWLPTLVCALSLSGQTFYAALGRLTLEIVYEHWTSISRHQSANKSTYQSIDGSQQLIDLLEAKETSMRQISGYLISPPRSGLFLGRETIATFARENQLPRGFGTRQQMMANLFRSAAQYDLMPKLIQNLLEHCDAWNRYYNQLSELFPQLASHLHPWVFLVSGTYSALEAMKERVIASV